MNIHVSSKYGVKSVPYNDLGASIDHDAQVLLAQKLLSELARDAGAGKKDVQQREEAAEAANKLGSGRAAGGTSGLRVKHRRDRNGTVKS
jgi:tartrate dehydratase alpha subunit/fumarate hydratase class I-like protein